MAENRPTKRQKVDIERKSSLNRDISPPPLRRQKTSITPSSSEPILISSSSPTPPPDKGKRKAVANTDDVIPPKTKPTPSLRGGGGSRTESDTLIISSPFRLTRIQDLPSSQNKDAISLSDILTNPLISSIWSFNFMHDLRFVVSHLDPDTAHSTPIKIIHGNWKKEDPGRIRMEAEKEFLTEQGYQIELIKAYMPDAFGTHHTKMMILFYHDDSAEVVVHTANMIEWDWRNMTQAVWRSPRLPLLKGEDGESFDSSAAASCESNEKKAGVGWVFKEGLMAYLGAYDWRTKKLREQLKLYDFKDVRAVFVGHVPGEHPVNGPENKLFGWGKVKRVLTRVSKGGGHGVNKAGKAMFEVKGHGEMVMQCSSVATLGESYFDSVFYPTFSTHRSTSGPANAFSALGGNTSKTENRPKFSLVFPTAEDVRASIEGWQGGSPIFMKSDKPNAATQIKYLRPMLATWAQPPLRLKDTGKRIEAGRSKATPHIKTYNLFSPPKSDIKDTDIEEEDVDDPGLVVPMDWAMITSANLSKQAWGMPLKGGNMGGTLKIQSYEAGVLVHPALYNDLLVNDDGYVQMYAVGGKDDLSEDGDLLKTEEVVGEGVNGRYRKVKVGVRLPYDYPLRKYTEGDEPWCSDKSYGLLADGKNLTWNH